MRPIAIIEAENPTKTIDTIIIWEDGDNEGRLVGFAYQDGQPQMTRPLTSTNPATEALEAFGATIGSLTTIHDRASIPARVLPTRWQ